MLSTSCLKGLAYVLEYIRKVYSTSSCSRSTPFPVSSEQRLQNHKALNIMMIGRNVENLDMQLRFGYPFRRVALAYDSLKRYCREMNGALDDNIGGQLDQLITSEVFDLSNEEYKIKLIKYVNQLVRV